MIKLTLQGDCLYLGDAPLIYRYSAGDIDLCTWPFAPRLSGMSVERQRGQLAVALFDARETGDLPGDSTSVTMPDDLVFDFDEELATWENSSEYKELKRKDCL